jgi:hypothetical protein
MTKFFRTIKTPHCCSLLQMDIYCIPGWCTADHMKINVCKTRVISVTRKTSIITCEYKICESRINRTDTVKDLGVILDTTLYFYHHVDNIFSQSLKLLDLICATIFSFSSTDSLFMSQFALVSPKLEYASVAWNTLLLTPASLRACSGSL